MITHKDLGPRSWRERPAFWWEAVKFKAGVYWRRLSK